MLMLSSTQRMQLPSASPESSCRWSAPSVSAVTAARWSSSSFMMKSWQDGTTFMTQRDWPSARNSVPMRTGVRTPSARALLALLEATCDGDSVALGAGSFSPRLTRFSLSISDGYEIPHNAIVPFEWPVAATTPFCHISQRVEIPDVCESKHE